MFSFLPSFRIKGFGSLNPEGVILVAFFFNVLVSSHSFDCDFPSKKNMEPFGWLLSGLLCSDASIL